MKFIRQLLRLIRLLAKLAVWSEPHFRFRVGGRVYTRPAITGITAEFVRINPNWKHLVTGWATGEPGTPGREYAADELAAMVPAAFGVPAEGFTREDRLALLQDFLDWYADRKRGRCGR